MAYPDLSPLLDLCTAGSSDVHDRLPGSLSGIHDTLAEIWQLLAEFTAIINFAARTTQRITLATFLSTMAASMYRLLSLSLTSLDETIRLALLAFTSSVFLGWKALGISYRHLNSELKKGLLLLQETEVGRRVKLWLLMIAAVTVFQVREEEWLAAMLRRSFWECGIGGGEWVVVKGMMEDFMWIGMVHDGSGEQVVGFISASMGGGY